MGLLELYGHKGILVNSSPKATQKNAYGPLKNSGERSRAILFFFTPPSFQSCLLFNPLSDMPILGCSYSAANKDVVSKEWTNGDAII